MIDRIQIFSAAYLLALGTVVTLAAPKTSQLELFAFEEPHMGTLFRIKLYAPDEEAARLAATAAFDRIEELDRICSDYIPDSELNRLERSPAGEPVAISNDLYEVLEESLHLARATAGAFDPTLGHYTNLWRRALRKGSLPTPEQLRTVRAVSGHGRLSLQRIEGEPTATLHADGLVLDLGGIAKGFAADAARAILEEHGLTRCAVAAGGDIRVGVAPPGKEGWAIPILAPHRDKKTYLASVTLENAAVSTSGDREQFVDIDGRSYSHIVDPRTGLGLTRQIASTVVARKAHLSDSYATALCILGPEEGLALAEDACGIEALIVVVDASGIEKRFATTGFPGDTSR